eukprot:458380_1
MDQINWSKTDISFLQFGSACGLFGCVVSIILTVHVVYNYISSASKQPYYTYWLVITHLITAFIVCIVYAFIRNNLFTQISSSEFNTFQCTVSIFGSYAVMMINRYVNYVLFVYRIKIVFKDTVYDYNHKIYIAYYIVPPIIGITQYLIVILSVNLQNMALIGNETNSFLFCSLSKLGQIWIIIASISGLIDFIQSAGLLYMFIKGLYSVNQNVETANNRVVILMKKQTILVSITIVSTFMYWTIAALFKWFAPFVCLDLIVNSICIWLMFTWSKKYWTFCIDYGCCYCCYKQKLNKNVELQINPMKPVDSASV